MIKRFLCVAVLLLPTLLLGQDDGYRTIAIQVTDAVTGRRLANAVVAVGSDLMEAKSTDRNGLIRMSIRLPSAPMHLMVVSSDWHLQGRVYRSRSTAWLPADPIFEIRILPGATITGTIFDSNRKPVANANVTALRLSYDVQGRLAPPRSNLFEDVVVTNRAGEFRIGDLPSGDYILRLEDPPERDEGPALSRSPRFYAQYFPATASWEQAKVIHLESGMELKLGVTALDTTIGAPVHVRLPAAVSPADAEIRYRLQATSVAALAFPASERVGQIPHVGFDLRLPYGEYTIDAGQQMPPLRGTFISDATEKTVTLASGYGQIRLKAQMATGEDIPSNVKPFLNLFLNSGYSFEHPQYFSMGQRGVRRLINPAEPILLAAGTVRLLPAVRESGFRVSAIRVHDRELHGNSFDVAPDSDTLLTVVLSKDMTLLSGTITDDSGNAVANAVVALLPDDRSQEWLKNSTVSDANGKFSIEGPAGDYHLFAWYRMEGSAHRNAGFMKQYDAKGIPVRIGSDPPMPITLHPLDLRDQLR